MFAMTSGRFTVTADARWGRLWLRPEAIAELSELANAWILADVEPEDERVQGGAI